MFDIPSVSGGFAAFGSLRVSREAVGEVQLEPARNCDSHRVYIIRNPNEKEP